MENKDRITICIPVRDSLSTIKIILNSLNYQNVYPKIIILDNGSKDGTFEALCAMKHNHYFKDLNIELQYIGESPTARRISNLEFVRRKFCEIVDTEFLFFLDSDVLLPPDVINDLIEEMDNDKELGMLGIKYDVNTNHVKVGATLFRTEDIKNQEWDRDEKECQCIKVAKELLVRGKKVKHYDKLQGRHLKAF